jgi:AraC family transcriptional regulator
MKGDAEYMDWSERLNAAVAYIEENLAEEIDFNEAAKRAFCSIYHFYRMFFAVSGMTPAEYSRQRRLTLAAKELLSGDVKVIDIAARYGYDSPSAFARAFRNLHGVTPVAARAPGVQLASFQRISFPVEIKGGDDMDYQIIDKPAFDIVGRSTKFGVASGEFSKRGRTFWSKYVCTGEYKALCDLTCGKLGTVTGAPVLTAYMANENGVWDPVVNIFGIEKTDEMDIGGFEVFRIPAASYAEFSCTMNTSASTNKYIYGEWFPSTGYERDDGPDIATFSQMPWNRTVYVRWWIPIIKK